ncbi:MAG: glycosyltransferase family 87 protein [Rhodopirellula sp. JB044]|uniref:glycosyltransferase family 87 protein n=1 Tax=Rhodopirellula sp. JB044 TaxID=3342844 RepID=UPI00370B99BB
MPASEITAEMNEAAEPSSRDAANEDSQGHVCTTAGDASTGTAQRKRDDRDHWHIRNRPLAILATIMLTIGLCGTVYRTIKKYQVPGPFTPDKQGLCDFHNGIYFPTRAVLAGESPYSDAYAAKYPVARQIPFFSPVILLLHAPLAILPLHLGEALNMLLQIAILFAIAGLVAHAAGFRYRLDVALAVAAVLIFTRGGHITLFNGYFTFQLVLATFLSVAWAERRPISSAWMLMIVSAKPTYILPLGFLMLARGNVRALTYGAILSIAAAVLPLGWIAYHEGGGNLGEGVSILIDQIVDTQEVHRSMEDESPVFSWTRLDLFAIVAKWAGNDPGDLPHLLAMFGLLAFPMLVLYRRMRRGFDDGIAGWTGAILMLGLLVSLYHQSYDSLLLTAPIAGAIGLRLSAWRDLNGWVRWSLIALMALPAFNYLSTRTFLNRFEMSETTTRIFTSLNGVSLAIALLLICVVAWPAKSPRVSGE